MRVISFFLPQFHEVEENSRWWGEGFTDWNPTREAKPLFEGHYQPHIPRHNNYYDLSKRETLQWQADLMHKYGVDGQAFYHYWFKDGRKILEKPAENLLEWKEIDMPFCFYWANESWVRSWSNVRQDANPWMSDEKPMDTEQGDGVLLLQDYGAEAEWRQHFDYLLPFFRDKRYIKVEEKPLFVIYKSTIIPEMDKMLECWKRWAVESGLAGLYVIGAYRNGSIENSNLDAQLYHEPPRSSVSFFERARNSGVAQIDYDELWNYMLKEHCSSCKTYYSGFTGYDDSPRRGTRGWVCVNGTPLKFEKYLTELMAKNEALGADITFVNAWNEWGEGMHLEPDEQYGEAFLEAVRNAKMKYAERVQEYKVPQGNIDFNFEILQKRCDKYEMYMNYFDIWMTLRENGKSVSAWLLERGYKSIAVYGYGIMGRHLVYELQNSELQVVGIIDQQKDKLYVNLPVYLPTEQLPQCDVVIVSAFFFMDEIRQNLPQDMKLVSLGNILREMTT